MATCRNYLSILSENFIKIGSAKDILYAKGDRHPMSLLDIFSTTSQTYDVINIVATSPFLHPAFCISVQIQRKFTVTLSDNHVNIYQETK